MTAAEALREAARMCRERAYRYQSDGILISSARATGSALEAIEIADVLEATAVREEAAEKAKGGT